MSTSCLRKRLEELLNSQEKTHEPLQSGRVVLYGAGARGRELMGALRVRGFEVAAFIDRAVSGQIEGIDVFAPDHPVIAELAAAGCHAIVAVFNPETDPLPIHELLQAAGFQRVIGVAESRQCLETNNSYWLASTAAMILPVADATWLFEKLADDLSRHTLLEAIELRSSCDPKFLRSPLRNDQYFPAGVPLPRTAVRFVDGGAFDGDTIASLTAAGFAFDAIAAFEPDPVNYAALVARLMTALPCQEVSAWPCALDSAMKQLRFAPSGQVTSKISDEGALLVQAVSFDAALPNFKPTYVKLDIEGGEAAALRGMKQSLRSSLPSLAVSVYHRPRDLWEIPRLVEEIMPNAQFYLRAHAFNGFETVLYAVTHALS